MNWKPVITTAAILAVGGISYAAYRYVKKQSILLNDYTADVIGISVLKWTNAEAVIRFTVRLMNKSDIEATLKEAYADITINDTLAGNVATTDKKVIPAKGYADINLQLVFSPAVVLKNAVDILLGVISKKDITYRMKGYVRISSGFVPVEVPFNKTGSLKDFI